MPICSERCHLLIHLLPWWTKHWYLISGLGFSILRTQPGCWVNFCESGHNLILVFSLCGDQEAFQHIQLCKENSKLLEVPLGNRLDTSQLRQLKSLPETNSSPASFLSWAPLLLSTLQSGFTTAYNFFSLWNKSRSHYLAVIPNPSQNQYFSGESLFFFTGSSQKYYSALC